MRETYSVILPKMNLAELTGRLIVIEGTDGVGRSTQIKLLRPWLEQQGHAVLDTGIKRSQLAAKGNSAGQRGAYPGAHYLEPLLRHGFCRPTRE